MNCLAVKSLSARYSFGILKLFTINFYYTMSIFHPLMHIVDNIFPFPRVHAHCDIPCGVYTTHQAGIAAETVEKMVQKINDLGHHSVDASLEEKLTWENASVRI